MVNLESNTISVLHECCLCQAPALILDPESDFVWHARIESVSLESVMLCLFEEVSHPPESSSLFISFSHKGNCCGFFTTVLEYQSDAPQLPSYLTLQLPSRIIGMERRASYRIAIGEKVVPLVRLSTTEGRLLHPKPKDLSLTGIMVEFDESEEPDLPPSTELWMELRLDDHVVLLKSLVRNRNNHRYSLVFSEVFATKHGINAPQPLREIVKSLEHTFLQERSHLDKPLLTENANAVA